MFNIYNLYYFIVLTKYLLWHVLLILWW